MFIPDLPILRLWVILIGAIIHGFGVLCTGIIGLFELIRNSNKPSAEIHKTLSEAELNEARAQSIEFQDQLSAVGMMQGFIRDGLALEQLLQKKNDIIAGKDDEIFSLHRTIENQAADIQAYERMKLGALGEKRLSQSKGEEKTGTGE